MRSSSCLLEAQSNGAFETHAAELTGRPGHGEQRPAEASAGHGRRAPSPYAFRVMTQAKGTVSVGPHDEHAEQKSQPLTLVLLTSGPTKLSCPLSVQ